MLELSWWWCKGITTGRTNISDKQATYRRTKQTCNQASKQSQAMQTKPGKQPGKQPKPGKEATKTPANERTISKTNFFTQTKLLEYYTQTPSQTPAKLTQVYFICFLIGTNLLQELTLPGAQGIFGRFLSRCVSECAV